MNNLSTQVDVIDLKDGMNITGFYLVKRAEVRLSNASKKQYLDTTLTDTTGEINAKAWGIDEHVLETFVSGKIVKINAKVKMWNEKNQLSINKYRMSVPEDRLRVQDFVPTAPGDVDEYLKYIDSRIQMINDDHLRILTKSILQDKMDSFMIYPAAKSNHHAVRSGLVYHVYRMLRLADAMKGVYVDIDIDLLNAGIILHDLCKIDEMDINEVGLVTEYTVRGNMLGHISMGVAEIALKARELGIDGEIVMLLQHMILSHHYFPEFGSPVFPMFLEAELLHHIDVIDARVYDFGNIYRGMELGNVSEPIWSLDKRRVYRPKRGEQK